MKLHLRYKISGYKARAKQLFRNLRWLMGTDLHNDFRVIWRFPVTIIEEMEEAEYRLEEGLDFLPEQLFTICVPAL